MFKRSDEDQEYWKPGLQKNRTRFRLRGLLSVIFWKLSWGPKELGIAG